MIKQKITIVSSSYNMVDWEKQIILQCAVDNPNFNQDELAEYLGISTRTLIRKAQEYKLDITTETRLLIFRDTLLNETPRLHH